VMIKLAVTEVFAFMVTVHVNHDESVHPVQPVKVEFVAGIAVRVAVVPLTYGDVFPVTTHEPVPALFTARV
jgi:hypothetical protein